MFTAICAYRADSACQLFTARLIPTAVSRIKLWNWKLNFENDYGKDNNNAVDKNEVQVDGSERL